MDHSVFVFFSVEAQGMLYPVTGCDAIDGEIIKIRRSDTRLTEEPLQIEGVWINVTEMKEKIGSFQEYHLP